MKFTRYALSITLGVVAFAMATPVWANHTPNGGLHATNATATFGPAVPVATVNPHGVLLSSLVFQAGNQGGNNNNQGGNNNNQGGNATVPEPSLLVLLGIGLLGVVLLYLYSRHSQRPQSSDH